MDDVDIRKLLVQDLSIGTEEFRDALLARCLEEIGTDGPGRVLVDDELEMLAAAGDPATWGFLHDAGSGINGGMFGDGRYRE